MNQLTVTQDYLDSLENLACTIAKTRQLLLSFFSHYKSEIATLKLGMGDFFANLNRLYRHRYYSRGVVFLRGYGKICDSFDKGYEECDKALQCVQHELDWMQYYVYACYGILKEILYNGTPSQDASQDDDAVKRK